MNFYCIKGDIKETQRTPFRDPHLLQEQIGDSVIYHRFAFPWSSESTAYISNDLGLLGHLIFYVYTSHLLCQYDIKSAIKREVMPSLQPSLLPS